MSKALTGRSVLCWLVGFFTVVMAVNVCFIVISVKTFRGEDEQKPYLQGVEYNRTLAARAEQARLGWRASIGVRRLADGRAQLDVALRDTDGLPLNRMRLSAELRHPADENRDQLVQLREVSPGQYRADAGLISAGDWDLVITNADSGIPFEATRRLWVP